MSFRSVSLRLVVALALSACGGAAAPSILVSQAPTEAPNQPTTAPTPAPSAAQEAPTAAPTAVPSVGAPTVAIIDNAFEPANLTVSVGTSVTWTNKGKRNHTVSTADASFGSAGVMSSGATYAHTFDTAGTFAYFCAIHAGMKATITVLP
ncbi:MAG: cupredoxin domain-containing protein [Chloroflexi bacterium]|nr:cupredoxin domain-containing protein [Chloroflexota bacterium]